MGTYINIGNAGFQRARNSEYVDKSGLIAVVNSTLFTESCFSCVTRCRRFGKSMAARMLYAYYDHSCDSRSLFADLKIDKTESAMNNFLEYSMVTPRKMAGYFGFTKEEVMALAQKHGTDYDELEKWYDGYQIGDQLSMFNPNSVIQAIDSDWCESYWGKTGAYDAVAHYIRMNFDGLKDAVIQMLGGGRVKVNTTKFQNDMSLIESKDDVLTVLIHLGYLSYDRRKMECYVPNREVRGELSNAVEESGWTNVINAIEQSEKLLEATLRGDEEAVARGVDAAHDEHTSILSYNDERSTFGRSALAENSLACVLSLAFYYAHNDYVIHRELATGKGFADLVLIPRKHVSSPAIILELKYNQDADTAIDQIIRKQYPAKVVEYSGELLLVGISYDKKEKTHQCRILRIEKTTTI